LEFVSAVLGRPSAAGNSSPRCLGVFPRTSSGLPRCSGAFPRLGIPVRGPPEFLRGAREPFRGPRTPCFPPRNRFPRPRNRFPAPRTAFPVPRRRNFSREAPPWHRGTHFVAAEAAPVNAERSVQSVTLNSTPDLTAEPRYCAGTSPKEMQFLTGQRLVPLRATPGAVLTA